VLTRDEVAAVLARMSGVHGLLARLLYGTGMRITEALATAREGHRLCSPRGHRSGGQRWKRPVVMLPLQPGAALRDHLVRRALLGV
jgi:site-specific recombinase XerD